MTEEIRYICSLVLAFTVDTHGIWTIGVCTRRSLQIKKTKTPCPHRQHSHRPLLLQICFSIVAQIMNELDVQIEDLFQGCFHSVG